MGLSHYIYIFHTLTNHLAMKMLSLCVCLIAPILSAFGATNWSLQGKDYNVDTLNHISVGPGTTLTSLRLTGAQNLNIFYTTTDLSNPIIDMRVLKAKNTIYARQEVSGMALDNDNDSTQYFLGVNADFFNMRRGNSIGSQISSSAPIYVDNNGRTQWAWMPNKQTIMDEMKINCVATFGNNRANLSGINTVASTNSLTLYTPMYGTATDSVSTASEVILLPINDPLTIGKVTTMKVESSPKVGGATAIPSNGYVLSGTDFQGLGINYLKKGDIIEISTTVALPNGTTINPTEVVSGYPVILRDGETTDPVDILKHLNGLHPRTAVGNDASGRYLTILIVDGRSEVSDGCTSKVLADIMRYVGCDDAINLDGGGSSELYVKNLGICNVPSDGVERTVANGLYAVAKVPVDNEITSIAFANYRTSLKQGDSYTPVIYGYNKYGILIDSNVKGIKLNCSKKAGSIKGESFIAKKAGTHTLTARLGKLSATTTIIVAHPTVNQQ